MHAIWSRAAQVQSSCRCRLLPNTAITLVRRSTTAASRRKFDATDFFTACYTSILGTAAIIDAQRKEARRKELDEQLEKAKSALNTTTDIQEGSVNELVEENDGSSSSLNERRSRLPLSRANEKTTSELLKELALLCDITRSPSGRSTWIEDQIDWIRVEATIIAEENDPECVLREPKSAKQLGLTTDTVLQLANGLLIRAQMDRNGSPHSGGETIKQLTKDEENILSDLEDVRTGLYYPSYAQPAADPEKSREVRSLLNESLRRIFNQASSSLEIVGRICYNLLTSSYPPTIHTFNVMIAGFNRIHRPDLAQVVVDSYVHDTAWPATQQTMVCLLNHYRAKNDVQGLRDVIARMKGVRGTGLHFCILSKDMIYSKEWLLWATTHCASRKNTFVQRAHRGSEVFDSIIRGWLHHGDLSTASMAFIACIRSGSWIPIQTIHRLFTACLAAVDHTTARQMIRGIVKNLEKFAYMVDRTFRHSNTAMSLKLVESLSKLIYICGLPLQTAANIVDQAYAASLQQLEYLVSTASIQLELQASARLCMKVSESIESSSSLLTGLEEAVKIVDASQWHRKPFDNYDTVARLLSIDKRYEDLRKKGRALSNRAKAIIIKVATGLDVDPTSILTSGPQKNPYSANHYLGLAKALERLSLTSSLDSLTQSYVKAELVRGIPNPHLARRLRLAGQWEHMSPKVLASFYGPGAVTFSRPENFGCSCQVRKLEEQLLDSEDFIKAILFSFLKLDRQKRLRALYSNWYTMPLEPLVDYHMRRQVRGRGAAIEQPADNHAGTDANQENILARPAEVVGGVDRESSGVTQSTVECKHMDGQPNDAGTAAPSRLPRPPARTEDSILQYWQWDEGHRC